jgi:hypothetical protein
MILRQRKLTWIHIPEYNILNILFVLIKMNCIPRRDECLCGQTMMNDYDSYESTFAKHIEYVKR